MLSSAFWLFFCVVDVIFCFGNDLLNFQVDIRCRPDPVLSKLLQKIKLLRCPLYKYNSYFNILRKHAQHSYKERDLVISV
jgi:hypothetical protein